MFTLLEKLWDKMTVSFSFLNRTNSPSNKAVAKYSSVQSLQQAGRDINNVSAPATDTLSDLEWRVLKYLYLEHRASRRMPRWNIQAAYKELGVREGSYVGVLTDSSFVKLEGEELMLTNAGIRYMDERVGRNRPRVDIVNGLSVSGGADGNHIHFELVNEGSGTAFDISFALEGEGLALPTTELVGRLASGEKTARNFSYRYNDTELFQHKVKNPRIVFSYKDSEGFEFKSGRAISQTKRADDKFNIHHELGNYFES